MKLKPKKSLGQNFLIDKNIINKIVNTIDIKDKYILEIGPGTGNLTSSLLEKNPNEFTILYHKLRLLKKLDRFEESNEICNKILKQYPSNIEIRNELIK